MRILGFSKKWEKLSQPEFTTFRFIRKDRDWEIGEVVQVVYKPRQKGGGELMGVAEIIALKARANMQYISESEVRADGFESYDAMDLWMEKMYGYRRWNFEPMNKLTLRWVKRK